jgi:hypothetical protein
MGLINLTPLGPGWGWGSRAIEIVAQALSLILVQPLVLLHRGLEWLLSKILP